MTRLEEARAALAAGADALVAQGGEAGGHRGSFDDDDRDPVPLLELLAGLHAAMPDARLVGAGGVMEREDVAAVLDAGAQAAQCGSAFLLADEAGTSEVHRAAVASDRPTALTRAFTGRTARGVENEFMRRHRDAPSAYPQLHRATAPMRAAARVAGDPESTSLWAGTRHDRARPAPAREIVRALAP